MSYTLIHRPYTLRHLAYHFVGGLLMMIDGIVVVLTLGIAVPGLSVDWILKWGDRLYQHQEEPPSDENITQEQFRQAMADKLGVPVSQIHVLDSTENQGPIIATKAGMKIQH